MQSRQHVFPKGKHKPVQISKQGFVFHASIAWANVCLPVGHEASSVFFDLQPILIMLLLYCAEGWYL